VTSHVIREAFATLGIEPCEDPRSVRRAYAARLKETRPDDDPEGFGRLRSAYERALDWTRRKAPSRTSIHVRAAETGEPSHREVIARVREPLRRDADRDDAEQAEAATKPQARRSARDPTERTVDSVDSGTASRPPAATLLTRRFAQEGIDGALDELRAARWTSGALDERGDFEAALARIIESAVPFPEALARAAAARFGWDRAASEIGPFGSGVETVARRLRAIDQRRDLSERLPGNSNPIFFRRLERRLLRSVLEELFSPFDAQRARRKAHWDGERRRMAAVLPEYAKTVPEMLEFEVDQRALEFWRQEVRTKRLLLDHAILTGFFVGLVAFLVSNHWIGETFPWTPLLLVGMPTMTIWVCVRLFRVHVARRESRDDSNRRQRD
jgi:pyruvate/2-oxoglutarate dehydrogenase complex dihydrolipoamide acyltransferase (E2) component